ncbi:MAG: cytochrome-c oxidase, cbb3-type subunit III [Halofilum sp. (in: g-proteobacteria)]|nr:cytochrome-c oxidase, cbb3-type subunit III [Halofilum sp. (in: g-proteobacteria)]
MSAFWTGFIVVLTLANIAACWWLIRWTAKPRPNESASTETTGHVWDEDLTEYNQPMPRWWLNLFYITIFFALIYLVLYPGLGSYAGVLGWSQYSEYEAEVEAAEERVAPLYAEYAAQSIPQLAENESAMRTGQRIFANNCAVCHGSDGRGAVGFPNLTDDSWLYGGEPEQIRQTLINGRSGVMPGFGQQLGERDLRAVAAYVYTLNGRDWPRQDLVAAGKEQYQTLCVACHGPNGEGKQALGAPNLTDKTWLYGGSMDELIYTLKNGRNGQMPAFQDLLGEDRVHVVAAYVWGLSHGESKVAGEMNGGSDN